METLEVPQTFREVIVAASRYEPTERILLRMRSAIDTADLTESEADELHAYVDLLGMRVEKLREALV